MLSSIFAFLGGSAFRMMWGEISHWVTEAREHKREIERMRVQGDLEAAAHARNLESIRLQADLGVKTIQVQAEADLARLDAEGFYAAARDAIKPTGIRFVDAWNGSIRPACATFAIFLWVRAVLEANLALTDWDRDLIAAIFGFFFASRELSKRGK